MSISLRLIPKTLALRTLPKNYDFDGWINSNQVRIPTTFNNEKDIIRTIRMAGYNTDYFCGSIRTNLNCEDYYVFWEYIDNQYIAVFSKLFSREVINFFIGDLERKSGRVIFSNVAGAKIEMLPGVVYSTNFRDEKMLIKTLEQLGIRANKKVNGDLSFIYLQENIIFHFNNGVTYTMEIKGSSDNHKDIYLLFLDIDEQYNHNVQEETYLRLKDKLYKGRITIENEEIEQDNSITLTLGLEVD